MKLKYAALSLLCCVSWGRRGGLLMLARPRTAQVSPSASLALSGDQALGLQVYSTTGCKYCRMAKATLADMRLPFLSIDVQTYSGAGQPMAADLAAVIDARVAFTKTTTVPQIFIGGEYLGGCDALLQAVNDGSFSRRATAIGVLPVAPTADVSASEASAALSTDLALRSQGALNQLDLVTLSSILHAKILSLTDVFVTADGSRVDYKRMSASVAFAEYVAMSGSLAAVTHQNVSALTQTQRFCFFANLYNALIIHATCLLGPPADSPEARTAFFSGGTGALYRMCEADWSPDDIEHGVLRANTPRAPSQPRHFPNTDARAALALSSLDPRLHFILNCGAQSCPPIKVLAGDPAPALIAASSAYLDKEVSVDSSARKIQLPRLALWYASDFGGTLSDRVQLLLSLLSPARRASVVADLEQFFPSYKEHIDEADVVYNAYVWASNAA